MKRFTLLAVGAAGVLLALVLLLHTPLVRARVLQYALTTGQERFAIRLEATRLDYNLATLRAGLAGLRVSALDADQPPFFEADYLSVTVPGRTVFGAAAFDEIRVTNGLVRILRRADGTTNLPEASDAPSGEPPALDIARLSVPQLAIDIRDEQADITLTMPAVTIELAPDEGRIAMARPAELRVGERMTRFTQLEGGVSFDGRALHLADVQVRADEASARASGSVELIARNPEVDLRVQGAGDVERLARWGMEGNLPRGSAAFDARVTGSSNGPEAELQFRTDRLAWQGFEVTNVSGRARVAADLADIETLTLNVAGGEANASGMVPFGAGVPARLRASLRGVDAATLVLALAPDAAAVPSATVSGDADLAGPLNDLGAWTANGTLRLDPGPAARGRVAVAGAAAFTGRDGMWTLRGRQTLGGGAARIAEDLRGRLEPPTVAGTLRVDETTMPQLLAVLRTAELVDAPPDVVQRGSLEAGIALSGLLADPQIQVDARVRDLAATETEVGEAAARLAGRPFARQLGFTVDAATATLAGETVSQVHSAGRLAGDVVFVDELTARQAAAPGTLTGSAIYDLRTARYTASLDATEWQLTPGAGRPLAGRLDAQLSGRGTTEAPRGSGRLTLRGAEYVVSGFSRTTLGDIEAGVDLDGQAATIDVRAPDFQATAGARVQLAAPYAAVVNLNARNVDLARVLQGVETPTPIQGTFTVAAHAEGPLEAWRSGTARVEVSSLDAKAGDLVIRLVEAARLRYDSARIHVDGLEVAAGGTRLSASGELPAFDPAPDDPALLVTLTGDVDAVARAVRATGLTDLAVTGGRGPVALLARVTGSARTPVVAADLEVGPGSISLENLEPISALTLRAHSGDGWLELRDAAASYQGAMLTATGRAPLSLITGGRIGAGTTGELAIQARATNLTPAVLDGFVESSTLEQLAGSVDARVELRSPTRNVEDVVGELRLDRMDLRVAELPITQRTPTLVVVRDGFARIQSWDWQGQGADVRVLGQVRLSDRQAAILANGEVDLRTLTPFVRTAGVTTAGRLTPRLSMTGALDNPRFDGDMVVSGGELRLADPRILVSDLSARAVLTGTSARLVSLAGTANGGPLTGTGMVTLNPDGGVETQLSTTVHGMALEFPPGLRSEADAALAVALKIDEGRPSGSVTGTVTVVRGSYRQPLAVVTGLLTTLRTRRLAAVANSSPVLESLDLDIRLITDEDVIVDNNYGRFQLGGDLRLIGTAAVPALSGRAELREGGRLFVGRNIYTINAGVIDFANPVTIEPDLNIDATTRAGGEEIEVAITGTPDNISVVLDSPTNPDLGQADLTSLLLTGRTFENLAPGDAAFVGTQVLGNFSAEVLGFASQAVGLDTLRLGGVEDAAVRRDVASAATEIDPTTRLTFGKSFGPNIDVTFSQSLRESDAQTWIVDYLPRRRFELRLVSNDEDLRSYGLRHDLSFGAGPPRAIESAGVSQRAELRVTTVELAGDLVLAEARVRDLLRLAPGDRFGFVEWQNDRDRLERFYQEQGRLTARVNATRMETDTGVALRYEISPGPQTTIAVTGLEIDGPLRSQLETAWVQAVFDEFVVDEASSLIRARLARDGHLQPTITAAIVGDVASGGNVASGFSRKTLTVAVDPGLRTPVASIRVEGVDDALRVDVEAFLGASGLGDRAMTDPGAVERELAAHLRSSGYLRARVTAGAPVVGGGAAVLPVTVDPGLVFTIARVSVQGSDQLPMELVRDAAALVEGSPYDPAEADRARDRVTAFYRREGFPAPVVMVEQNVSPDSQAVGVTLKVQTGARQVLSEVVVAGNRSIDTDVVTRALDLDAGAPLRPADTLQARRRVFDTGLFRRVDVAPEAIDADADPAATKMRLRVTVEEWPALRLRYGFQAAEERPEGEIDGRELVPGVTADLTRRTLFGRAITLGGAMALQRREQMGRVFVSSPTLLGWPIESSLIAERAREEFPAVTLLSERGSVSWEQRARVLNGLTLSYAYRFDRDHTFETDPDPNDPLAFDVTVNIARLTGSGAWDTRDDPYDATRGSLFSSSFEWAPEAAGSEIHFIRHVGQAYHFRPWRGAVLASAGRVGMVRALGDQELLTTEKFFAGGAGTVRGIAEDSLGELDFFGAPRGGGGMVVLNQEVRVPVYRWVRAIGFVDAGNVFGRARDLRLGDLVGSAGVGVRLATPFALLRADVARPVWGSAPERSWKWTFGIGHAF
jgi:outer membrane protein assembly factor BamA/autotransporter translocation and assembly factor TamB